MNAPVTLKAFGEYGRARFEREEAARWLSHVGKHGQGSDVLRISPVHSSIKVTICGQYTEGGQNYWECPEKFGPALIRAVVAHWKLISETAMGYMTTSEDAALIAAEGEVTIAAEAVKQARERAQAAPL